MHALIIFLKLLILVLWAGICAANCPDNFVDVEITSFGVHVCANDGVDRKYLEHASSVVTCILDYNVDGMADN